MSTRIGTAAWTIPADFRSSFSPDGSHLKRYSQIFNSVEINSTFYKFHRAATFEKWASETPDDFQFSFKLHKSFTHESDLKPGVQALKEFFNDVKHLGSKGKVLLLQFPGKIEFHPAKMERFYELILRNFNGHIVIEPRNESWLSLKSRQLLKDYKISKVIADPERCLSSLKGITSYSGITYYRLHGSPVIYRSAYTQAYLKRLSKELRALKNAWCIFDNTTFGAATGDALKLKGLLL